MTPPRLEWTQVRASYWLVLDGERVAEIDHQDIHERPLETFNRVLAEAHQAREKV